MTAPTHIVAKPGDRRSLCGLRDALPVVWVEAVDAHVRGWQMVICAECARVATGRLL